MMLLTEFRLEWGTPNHAGIGTLQEPTGGGVVGLGAIKIAFLRAVNLTKG